MATFRAMWIGPVISVVTLVALWLVDPAVLPAAAPILVLLLASPAIMWWVSRPLSPARVHLSVDQTRFLRGLSRKTWAFFETFVTEEENWLPPDNVQEDPKRDVARRTSPTNMGLALLAALSFPVLGYGYLRRNVGSVVLATAVSVCGAALLAAVGSERSTMLATHPFRGVGATLVVPPALFLLH